MLKRPIVFLNKKLNIIGSRLANTLPKPIQIHVSVTHRCTLRCKHCDIWMIPNDTKELSTKDLRFIFFQLRKWLGPVNVNIAGGEPFLKKDMIELIEYGSSLGLSLTITTHGQFITKEMAQRLSDGGLTGINISMDSLIPEKYDDIRGSKHGHEKAIQTIRNLAKTKVKVSLATIIMKPNLDEIERIIEWAESEGLQGVNFQPLIQNFSQAYEPMWFKNSELWPDDYVKVAGLVDRIIEMKKAGKKIHNSYQQLSLFKIYFANPLEHTGSRCLVGETNYAIDEYGDVRLCFFMKPVGNILKDPPGKIWLSEPARIRRTQIDSCKRNCNLLNCNFS